MLIWRKKTQNLNVDMRLKTLTYPYQVDNFNTLILVITKGTFKYTVAASPSPLWGRGGMGRGCSTLFCPHGRGWPCA